MSLFIPFLPKMRDFLNPWKRGMGLGFYVGEGGRV
jgi:hypothetical protein